MSRLPPLTPLLKKLLIALLTLWVAVALAKNFAHIPLDGLLVLDTSTPSIAWAWQLFTHSFSYPPAQLIGLLIGGLFLWWMGAPFEAQFGPKRFMQLWGAAVVSSAIPAMIVGPFLPVDWTYPLFGVNPILLAIIAAQGWAWRHRGQISLFGVVAMKPIQMIWLVLGLSLLFFLMSRNLVGLIADLGAVGAGIGFAEWTTRPPKRRKRKRRDSGRRKAHGLKVIEGGEDDRPRWLN